ncbi:hypothetical protein LB533_20160 [Mesorhizobium sp. BR1-1-13]|uniref:hypothetical protein n=1 Tax=Mesorhizobium sp. BR1-1-13 TaxID=2876656 RepID=UPI001CD09CDF|nr:hypothetical protein [Mesorhizobium sp. BR1-1-13]MBZ9943403.1 hypothetical protein [Mesorhizobium sp. BR1-1-13]
MTELTDDLRKNHYVAMRSDSGVAYRDTIIPTERERRAADVIDALVAALKAMRRHANVSHAVEQQADAALALARKGGE